MASDKTPGFPGIETPNWLKYDAVRVLFGWIAILVSSVLSWHLFLEMGPFEGDANIVCGYFSVICGIYIVMGLYTFSCLAKFLNRKEREREREKEHEQNKNENGQDGKGHEQDRKEHGPGEKGHGQEKM